MPPVDKNREGVYLILFTVQFIGWLVMATLRDSDPIAVVEVMAPAVLVSTATTYVIVQGTIMLAERYLKRRYEEGKEEGEAIGEARGEEKGLVKGKAEAFESVRDWVKRKEEAEAKGEEFNEPPPYERG